MPVWSLRGLFVKYHKLGLLLFPLLIFIWNSNTWAWTRLLQLGLSLLFVGLGFLHLFFSSSSSGMASMTDKCAVCSKPSSKLCSRCKSLRYCSTTCQAQHWKSEHKRKCQQPAKLNSQLSPPHRKYASSIALVPSTGPHNTPKLVDKVLFPYEEFLKLFNWDKELFPPCGLLNCGNSCFANVVLQCLAHTRPLVAYLLDKGHRKDCRRNEWCFLCELQQHMERASTCRQPFSPITILSRLPTIGGNMGNGRQEDAHEFMRFAIDKMQSVCLDEHGGEKFIHPKSQETTLIQHIFGGQLQSQVVCTQCNQVSRQYENMMDLTIEIQGDATSLEKCLNQFTMKEWLHGDNLYKCDRCNDYVGAWKRLTIQQAPNILTIALKRFQSGRFGKINKRITFPENLDLSPYMSEGADGTDIYKLYAVVVHLDMLNASFFGHYICYTKGFQGDWYRIDDCKVTRVELDEVLSQGAYMLMYSRVSARPTCLKTFESSAKQKLKEKSDSAASHGSVEGLGVTDPVSALRASENGNDTTKVQTLNAHCVNGQNDVQCSLEASDLSGTSVVGLHASCGRSYNAPITDLMSLEEISDGSITINGVTGSGREFVKQGHWSENEGGNHNDENIAAAEGGRHEETISCGREENRHPKQNDGEDAVEMELDDAKVKYHCSGATDGIVVNVNTDGIWSNPNDKSSLV